MLAATDITLTRGGNRILDGVGLALEPGARVAVLGPNGAGKSTLVKVLSGELEPDRGAVTLESRALADYRPRALAQRRAVLPQESTLAFPFSVREVVALGRLPHESGAVADAAAVARALERTGLEALSRRAYPTLSGGEKQRVQLARVLAQLDPAGNREPLPRALLLDEPVAGLDLKHQQETLRLARELAAGGVAVLAVLHDLNQALAWASHCLLLCAGRERAAGPPAEVLTPQTVRDAFAVDVEARPDGHGGRYLMLRA